MNKQNKQISEFGIDLVPTLVENSVDSFKNLVEAKSLTVFDEVIFGRQIHCIRSGVPIRFETVIEENFRKIRATRLRILGYKWNKLECQWEL